MIKLMIWAAFAESSLPLSKSAIEQLGFNYADTKFLEQAFRDELKKQQGA
jgi:hypothetical protein